MVKQRPGLFIVFEGIDGAGTTTQTQKTTEWLAERGERVHRTFEPSNGPLGNLLRQVLAGRLQARPAGKPAPLDPATVALLFAADRLDHLQNEVVPFLEAGYHVVCDRYLVSSLAYQSIDVPLPWVRQLNARARDPDLTFFLQLPAEVAMGRIESTRPGRDSFENLPFQRKVAAAYDSLFADWRGGDVVTVDGERSVGQIFGKIKAELKRRL